MKATALNTQINLLGLASAFGRELRMYDQPHSKVQSFLGEILNVHLP